MDWVRHLGSYSCDERLLMVGILRVKRNIEVIWGGSGGRSIL